MSALDQWGVDIFSLQSLTNGHSLVAVTYTVFKVCNPLFTVCHRDNSDDTIWTSGTE